MTRHVILPLLFGLIGAAVLIGLGTWQVQRLIWKEGVLAEIEARIADAPVALSDVALDYQAVTLTGQFVGEELHVLASLKHHGAIYRVISGFETNGGQRVLVDRGFIATEQKNQDRLTGSVTIIGNQHSPVEIDGFTPEPDVEANIWYARDVPRMAEALGTDEIFVILRETSENDPTVTPLPVDTSAIPNDHLGYAITWFSLAIVWLGMTGVFVWRIRQKDRKGQQK